MRGARPTVPISRIVARIIPADAGSTVSGGGKRKLVQDHPRGCGEHLVGEQIRVQAGGSSPRMRGARIELIEWAPQSGIIPADAGSTWCGHDVRSLTQDHPRGCGEHSSTCHTKTHWQGSSPRMRGAPPDLHERIVAPRIIPADAGSTRPDQ